MGIAYVEIVSTDGFVDKIHVRLVALGVEMIDGNIDHLFLFLYPFVHHLIKS